MKEINGSLSCRFLPLEDFHKLRRRIRLFQGILQVPAAENVGHVQHWLFFCLRQLSVRLGEIHDEYLRCRLDTPVPLENWVADQYLSAEPYLKASFKIPSRPGGALFQAE
ncbi:MAG: hypothetical protein HY978_04235 [Candidatus Liptonbacteria bacterium]|nr:hypothetical protein [Candidatus Liptonbacteria bacterium]